MIDFLFLYEHRARELENCIYLSEELKNRGYSAKICYINSFKRKLFRPKVVVVPHLYDESQLRYYISSIWKKRFVKVINMQYEQILSESGRETEYWIPKREAQKAYHVAWGDSQKEDYIKGGIEEDRILKVGCIGLDFDTSQYRDYLITKKELAERFNIPFDKKWILFLSSFTTNHVENDTLLNYPWCNGDNLVRLKGYSIKCKHEILNWFSTLLREDTDCIVIYRKHPSEEIDTEIVSLKETFPKQFFLIDLYSIRHWIAASSVCSTFSSTSAVDVLYAKKRCLVLRPVSIDKDIEMEHLRDIRKESTYEEFKRQIYDNEEMGDEVMANWTKLRYYYDNEIDSPVVKKYIDAFLGVLNKNEQNEFITEKEGIRLLLVQDLMGICADICAYIKLSYIFRVFSNKLSSVFQYYERDVYNVRYDIKKYVKKMQGFLSIDLG